MYHGLILDFWVFGGGGYSPRSRNSWGGTVKRRRGGYNQAVKGNTGIGACEEAAALLVLVIALIDAELRVSPYWNQGKEHGLHL